MLFPDVLINPSDAAHERPSTFYHNRVERPSKDRGQRVRKLQLSDVDW